MRHAWALLLTTSMTLAWAPASSASPTVLEDYLPRGGDYDDAIPKPAETFGFEVGEWHLRPDLIVAYLERLAAASDRISIEVQGQTYEQRKQLLLTVTSPPNHARIEEIRRAHLSLSDPSATPPDDAQLADMPAVVWLGYSIHGNEPSGANAVSLVAYHLAASQGAEVRNQLDNLVILLDPMLNPDGLARFAHWANMHKGNVLVGDPDHREHTEGFPSGRTNHYWFDLNRDWLLAQHPETHNRLRSFHRWRPNILTDHHEMGSNSTFFFQPGVPSRKNPLIPQRNVELTEALARHHAAAFDAAGGLYYSQEGFDDFYPGKGATYPDFHGGLGILFEQASSRGHVQDTDNGRLTFAKTIENQFRASLSTVAGALDLRPDLLRYRVEFTRESYRAAQNVDTAAYLVAFPEDRGRRQAFLELLRRHEIEVHALGRARELDGVNYAPDHSLVVPVVQAQALLVRTLFEPLTQFRDDVFYDVSTWSAPLAFGARVANLSSADLRGATLGERLDSEPTSGSLYGSDDGVYAYVFEWSDYRAPEVLYSLLESGVRARVATAPFRVSTVGGSESLEPGTVVVPVGLSQDADALHALVERLARTTGVDIHGVGSGLTPSGIDLGSPSLVPLELPRIAILVGDGVSAYEAGAAWHLLDRRFGIPVTLLESNRLRRVDLHSYTHLVLVDGRYTLNEESERQVADWVSSGGTIVGVRGGARFVDRVVRGRSGASSQERPRDGDDTDATAERTERRRYGDYRNDRARELVAGSIYEVELDLTHPIAYGYVDGKLPVFKSDTGSLEPSTNPYENVAWYSSSPRLSGYSSEGNQERLAGGSAIQAGTRGGGVWVQLADDPNFRAIWYGTNRLFLNSLFLSSVIRPTTAPSSWSFESAGETDSHDH